MSRTGYDIDAKAREFAGNWKEFGSFAWHREAELIEAGDNPDNWGIINTESRDSGLIEQSNSAALEAALEPYFGTDVLAEHASHWACGYVDGFAVRVYDANGAITPAFRVLCDLGEALEDYPLLDEEDYSRREYEATLENIRWEGPPSQNDYDLPDNWDELVWRWLWDNDQHALENTDDKGGYPSAEEIGAACDALGWRLPDDESDDTEE